MKRLSLFALVFIMALATYPYVAELANDDNTPETEEVDDQEGEEGEGEEEEEYDPENFTIDDIKYHLTASGEVEIVESATDVADLVIPEEITDKKDNTYKVTSIAEKVFYQADKLRAVTIPATVKLIGKSAFEGCANLATVQILGAIDEMGESAFKDCGNLTTVVMMDAIADMGDSVFENCVNLTACQLSGGVKKIGSSVFKGCAKLETFEIEGDIDELGDSVFESCGSLTTVKIKGAIKKMGKSVFKDCAKLEAIEIGGDIDELGDSVFEGCSNLETIRIEGNLEEIDQKLFKDCVNLKTIEINGDVKKIAESVFEGHKSLETVKIGGSVDEIGDKAFMDCAELKTFEIGKDLKQLGESAFENCVSLEEIKISGSLDEIRKNTFKGCTKLAKIEIETGVKEIGESAFEGCESLEEITIPGSVKKVGEMAFKDCIKLTNVQLEEGVEEIGDSAFEGCGDLKVVTIPATVKEIGESVFKGSSLTELVIPGSMKVIKDGSFKDCETLTKVELQEGVEVIGVSAFEGCTGLQELLLPKTSLKEIGPSAFAGCESLEALIVPGSVNTVGQAAYKQCISLETLEIEEGLEEMGDSVFVGCSSLQKVSLPGSLKVISLATFKDCEKIDSLVLVKGLEEIGESAFEGCKSLPNVSLPESLVKIAKAAFKDCEKIDSVMMAEGLKEIGESAFENCESLDSLSLPSTITTLEKAAFRNCKSIVLVRSEIREPFSIDPSVFEGIDSKAKLKVPKGTRAAYMKADGWYQHFAMIIGGIYRITLVSKGYGVATCENDTATTDIPSDSVKVKTESITVRNDSLTYSFYEGDSILVAFASDKGYQIKDIMVNDASIADSLFADIYAADTLSTEKPRFGDYMIQYLDEDIKVAVEFEKIHYRLFILSIGQGTTKYGEEMIVDTTMIYRVEEGEAVTVTFDPAQDWRIRSVYVDSVDVTSEVGDYFYTIKGIWHHTKVEVEYEEIPVNQYILHIYTQGNGDIMVGEDVFRNKSKSYYMDEGMDTVITFRPDADYMIKSFKVNGEDLMSSIVDNQFLVKDIKADVNIRVSFDKLEIAFAFEGINYLVTSQDPKQVVVTPGDYGNWLNVPTSVSYMNNTWEVAGIQENALESCDKLAAVVWNPAVPFGAKVTNPNLLLYVKDKKYDLWSIQNLVVNGTAKNIILKEALNGNDFYCPKPFTAESISYTHNYKMETGLTDSKGWETIALPFNVQKITHSSSGEIVPFKKWNSENETKPFWLYELTSGGYQAADAIKAYTPYIISMPNNSLYKKDYRISGQVTFSAENVEVGVTEQHSAKYGDRTLVPNFTNQNDESILALNVNNDIVTNMASGNNGSKFIKGLRVVHPFEAYMTTTSGTRSIDVLDGMTTTVKGIKDMIDEDQSFKVYDIRGIFVKSGTSMKEVQQGLRTGVYVINGKKVIVK